MIRVSAGAAAGTTMTTPSHQIGDLLLAYAHRVGTAIITLPAGWTLVREAGGSSTSHTLAWRVATTTSTAFGTWGNASCVSCIVYRGHDTGTTPPIGVWDAAASTVSTTLIYDPLSLTRTDGTSWVAGFAGVNSETTNIETAPSGMTSAASAVNVPGTAEIAAHDTNGPVSSWTQQTITLSALFPWRTIVVEIFAPSTGGITSATGAATGVGTATATGVAATVATFGKTDIGGTFGNFPSTSCSSCRFPLTQTATPIKFTVYFKGTHISHTSGNARCLVYQSESGEPTNLLMKSDITFVPDGSDGWLDFPISAPVTLTPGDYYLAIICANNLIGAMDAAGTNRLSDDTDVNDPDLVFVLDVASPNQKSIYLTYTPTAGVTPGLGGALGTSAVTGVGAVAPSGGTFGKTAIGASVGNFPDDLNKSVSRFTCPVNANVQKLTIYFKGTNASHVGGTAQGLIYSVTGGEPDVRLGQSNVVTVPDGADGWVDFVFPGDISLAAGDYYLGVIAVNKLIGAFDTAGTNRYNVNTGYNGTSVFATNPFGTPLSSAVQKSIYATYTTGGVTTTSATASAVGVGTATGRAPFRSVGATAGTGTATGISSVSSAVALGFVGAASGAGTTLTLPAHVAGDLLLMFAYKITLTAPTSPSGWTLIRSSSGTGDTSGTLAMRIATAAGTASGTWTGAVALACHVYRGTDASVPIPVGASDMDAGLTTAMTYASLPLTRTNGTSWVVGFSGVSLDSSNNQLPPTGMTNRTSASVTGVAKIAGHDTASGENVWPIGNVTLNADANWRSITAEIYGTTGATPPVDLGLQYARPIADVATDNWTASSGTQLAPMIDETAPQDADFIKTVETPTTDTAIVSLSSVGAPLITSPYKMRVRARILVSGSSVYVTPGTSLQTAINAAAPGTTLLLEPGVAYPPTTSSLNIYKPLTITTLGWSYNGRVGLAQKSLMGQISMTSGNYVLKVSGGVATDVILRGLYFGGTGNDIILFGNQDLTQVTVDQMPTRCTLDQCIVQGLNGSGRRGLGLHCAYGVVTRNYIYSIRGNGVDSTAVGGVNGSGPFFIDDNFIEGASEGILFGGDDPRIAGMIPENIEISNNNVMKDPTWQGGGTAIKNHIEFKAGRYIHIHDNVCGPAWGSAQQYMFVITPSNPGGAFPQCHVAYMLVERNSFGPGPGGINLYGITQHNQALNPTQCSTDITFRDNWFRVNQGPNAQGWFHQVGRGPKNVTIEYNTIEMVGGNQWVQGEPNGLGGFPNGYVFRGNLVHNYGVYGSNVIWTDPVTGTSAYYNQGTHYFDYFPGSICASNAFIGDKASTMGPRLPGNLHGSPTTHPASLIVNGFGTGTLAGYGRRV